MTTTRCTRIPKQPLKRDVNAILHGLCTLGVIGHALLRALGEYDDARFKELAMRFSSPVYPGETIQVEIWRDGSFRALVKEREVVVVNNGYAVFAVSAKG